MARHDPCRAVYTYLHTTVQPMISKRIVISKLLKRQSKAKCRAPDYSRALCKIRGVVQGTVHGSFRSGCQRVRGSRVADKGRCSLGAEWKDRGSGESECEFLMRCHLNFDWKNLGVIDRGAGGWWWVIFNDGEKTEKALSSGGKSFQGWGAVMDMARMENFRWLVIGIHTLFTNASTSFV